MGTIVPPWASGPDLNCEETEDCGPGSLTPDTHLLPDVVVAEKAAQLPFGEWSPVVGVPVARQHLDAQSLHLAGVHGSVGVGEGGEESKGEGKGEEEDGDGEG